MDTLENPLSQKNGFPFGFEYIDCEICGCSSNKLVVERTDLFLGGNQLYRMVRCNECATIFQNPRPCLSIIDKFYPESYPEFRTPLKQSNSLKKKFLEFGSYKQVRFVQKYVKQGNLLDVGCATGSFLHKMQSKNGWRLQGVEPSQAAASIARSSMGLDVEQGDLFSSHLKNNHYDVITLWDVLEHIHEPHKSVARISELLRENGCLVINHPNLESIDRRVFGRFWLGYELPRHITLFPTNVLNELALKNNLIPVTRQCVYGSYSASATHVTLWLKSLDIHPLIKNVFSRIAFSTPARIISYPLFFLIDKLGLGSNVTVVFRKKDTGSSLHS